MNAEDVAPSVLPRTLVDVRGELGTVAMLVLLLTDPEMEPLGADSVRRLADLGVTRVGVFRDDAGIAITIDGWAFDPVRSAAQMLGVVAVENKEVRTLLQVADVAVSPPDARATELSTQLSRKEAGEGRTK